MKRFFSSTFFAYCSLAIFIFSWWFLAFYSSSFLQTFSFISKSSLISYNPLPPLDRATICHALAGDFTVMGKLIQEWQKESEQMVQKGIKDTRQLSANTYLQSQTICHLLQMLSAKDLHELNNKLASVQLTDDKEQEIIIPRKNYRFLPQTHISASFLLAIAPFQEIVALPKGLRNFPCFYKQEKLNNIPLNIDRHHSEKIYLMQPDLAFIAPYSHPAVLEVLKRQNIQLFTLNSSNTLDSIQKSLVKIGYATSHILESQLLSIFIEACFLAIDNRLLLLAYEKEKTSTSKNLNSRLLCLSYQGMHYLLPTTKSLTGYLLERLHTYFPFINCCIISDGEKWLIPFNYEKLVQKNPDYLIISTSCPLQAKKEIEQQYAVQQMNFFQKRKIFYIDAAIQDSPTQYIALAYLDLFHAFLQIYDL